MWRNDEQRVRACRALLAPLGLAHLWQYESEQNGGGPGPSAENCAMYLGRGLAALSHGESVLVSATWVLWNGGRANRQPTLDELMHVLDGTNMSNVGTLLVAFAQGGAAIDAWCDRLLAVIESPSTVPFISNRARSR